MMSTETKLKLEYFFLSIPLGVFEVNSLSKYRASSALQTAGLKGGCISFLASLSQSIVAKNECDFISQIPSGPVVRIQTD